MHIIHRNQLRCINVVFPLQSIMLTQLTNNPVSLFISHLVKFPVSNPNSSRSFYRTLTQRALLPYFVHFGLSIGLLIPRVDWTTFSFIFPQISYLLNLGVVHDLLLFNSMDPFPLSPQYMTQLLFMITMKQYSNDIQTNNILQETSTKDKLKHLNHDIK